MSSIAAAFPPPNGFPAKYEWAKWSDGQIHLCIRGDDFASTSVRFAQAARMHAERNDMNIRVSMRGDRVWLQMSPIAVQLKAV